MPADEEQNASDSAVFRKASASTRYAWLTEMNQKVNIDEHDSLMTSRNKCIVGATLHLVRRVAAAHVLAPPCAQTRCRQAQPRSSLVSVRHAALHAWLLLT